MSKHDNGMNTPPIHRPGGFGPGIGPGSGPGRGGAVPIVRAKIKRARLNASGLI